MQSATPPIVRPDLRYSLVEGDQHGFRCLLLLQEPLQAGAILAQAGQAFEPTAVNRGRILYPLHEYRHEIEAGVIRIPARLQSFPVLRPPMLENGGQSLLGFGPDAA